MIFSLSCSEKERKEEKMSCLMTKPTKRHVRPAKTQISLGIRVWSVSLLNAWRKLGSLATHSAHSEGSDQTGQMLGSHFVGFVMLRLKYIFFSSHNLPNQKIQGRGTAKKQFFKGGLVWNFLQHLGGGITPWTAFDFIIVLEFYGFEIDLSSVSNFRSFQWSFERILKWLDIQF